MSRVGLFVLTSVYSPQLSLLYDRFLFLTMKSSGKIETESKAAGGDEKQPSNTVDGLF